jgi:hypothetical protein
MDKAYILQQIRRTAEANGGIAPGKARFEAETGIKTYDWLGKHWARWSDAVREAGLTPNEMRTAYDEIDLLRKYADLAQELGRLPSASDLRLRNATDTNYPNQKVFERFGTKEDLIKRVLTFCEEHDGYKDVVQFCKEYSPRRQEIVRADKITEDALGSVYLLKSGKYFKIGRTNSIGRRENELGIQLPERITTVHVIQTDDPPGIEGYWHKRFAAKRKNGEWFELDASDVAAFKRRKFM